MPKFVESVKRRTVKVRRLDPAADLPAAGHRPRLGTSSRPRCARPARTRPTRLVAHENFLHLVMTDDPAEARRQQHEAFLKVMSNERGPNYLESVYLFGTPDEIIASLQARVDAGVEYFFLHTMTPDPAQLQLWVDHIIPNVHVPGRRPARSVARRRPGASAAAVG